MPDMVIILNYSAHNFFWKWKIIKLKIFERNKFISSNTIILYINIFAICICSHLQSCFTKMLQRVHPSWWTTPSAAQSLNCASSHFWYSLNCSGSMGLNPSMLWVRTLNKSPIQSANTYIIQYNNTVQCINAN